jgi:hypothetical protein
MIPDLASLLATCCPHCRSIQFRSVGARNPFERALAWLFHPYRCELCGRHVLLFRWQFPA